MYHNEAKCLDPSLNLVLDTITSGSESARIYKLDIRRIIMAFQSQ